MSARSLTAWQALAATALGVLSPHGSHSRSVGPAGSTTERDGKPAIFVLVGIGTVTVRPVREIANGRSTCSIVVFGKKSTPQRLVLIGAGETEALNCDGVVALGTVPAPLGRVRIGFLYRGHSPNAESLTPVFIEREKSGGIWSINDRLGQRIGERGELDTIPKIRAALKRSVD